MSVRVECITGDTHLVSFKGLKYNHNLVTDTHEMWVYIEPPIYRFDRIPIPVFTDWWK